jgi:hypothetical protein
VYLAIRLEQNKNKNNNTLPSTHVAPAYVTMTQCMSSLPVFFAIKIKLKNKTTKWKEKKSQRKKRKKK